MEDETMEHGPQATAREDARQILRTFPAGGVDAPVGRSRPYATWTGQIARTLAIVAIEVALQQALGPLFQLRRS
jgi:hypothetical protein